MSVVDLVEPTHRWVPDHVSTAGGEAIDLAAAVGLPLDPEQAMALDAILVESEGGKWAALEAAIIAPRQNIKTHVFKAVTLADLWLFDAELVVWTAHEFSTAMEAFRDVKALIEESDLLSKRVKRVTEQNGEEGVELMTGQRLRFKARTKTGGRGLTGTRTILDEAFALQPGHMGSLLPTMAAKSVTGNPQILYGSSAGQMSSAVLRSIRDRGRAGNDPSLVYLEWCAPEGCASADCDHRHGSTGCALDDHERWGQANLALGRRISVEFIDTLRRSLPPEEFAREVLGWWDEPSDQAGALPLELWALRARRDQDPVEPVALGVDVAPGQTSGSIGCYGEVAYIVEHGLGSSWIPSKVASLKRTKNITAIGLDISGPAAALVPDLTKPEADGGAGLTIRSKSNPSGELVLLTGREMQGACEGILAGIVDDRFAHRDQAVLNAAVEAAYQRKVGDSWKWSRRNSSADISPIVAVTEAFYLWSSNGDGPSIYESRGLTGLG